MSVVEDSSNMCSEPLGEPRDQSKLAASRRAAFVTFALSFQPVPSHHIPNSLKTKQSTKSLENLCISVLMLSQHFPCWRQAHHQPNVRVAEPSRDSLLAMSLSLALASSYRPAALRCHRCQTRTSRRECSLLSSLPPAILIESYIELLRSYLESGSLSFNNILAGRFGLAHSCARGQHILRATYVNGSQRSLTPTGLKSVPRTASYLLSRATGSLDVPIELTMNGFSFEEKRRKT
jgi:hypothetical protein